MPKPKFSLRHEDNELWQLVGGANHQTLAVWAIDCAEHVLPYFEEKFRDDHRPRQALDTLREWIATGVFSMPVIRKASLGSHAAARDVGEDSPARSAARAAGQAVATAHVPAHAYGSAIYAQQAVFRANDAMNAVAAAVEERDRQYLRLLELAKDRK